MLVLTGTGAKSFSSGYNIGKIGGGPSDVSFEELTDRLELFRLPTLCALTAACMAGRTDLALACDFRIGVEGMQMFMPAARLGLHYYAGGLRRYVSRLGLGAAKRLFLTAQPIDTAELLRIGYLDEAVPAERLVARVAEWVAMLRRTRRWPCRGTKASLNAIARGEIDLEAIAAATGSLRAVGGFDRGAGCLAGEAAAAVCRGPERGAGLPRREGYIRLDGLFGRIGVARRHSTAEKQSKAAEWGNRAECRGEGMCIGRKVLPRPKGIGENATLGTAQFLADSRWVDRLRQRRQEQYGTNTE